MITNPPDTSGEADLGSPDKQQSSKFTCISCRCKFDSIELQRAHFKTEWHLYNLKRRVCNLEPIDSEMFIEVQNATEAQQIQLNPKLASKCKAKHNIEQFDEQCRIDNREVASAIAAADAEAANTSATNISSDSDWESIHEEDLLDEDYDEEEAERMLKSVVKSDTCLFCSKKSQNIKANVNHMHLHHGFFVPEEQYLIDLEGLMDYLGFKVGAGATCLWCNKQFKGVHGARLHMLDKDHCKIMYDQDKALDEFKEFYDYSTQERLDMKPTSQLVIAKRFSRRRLDGESRVVVKSKLQSNCRQLMFAQHNLGMVPGSYQAKNIKKFNAYRAKIILRTGMANNQSMRGRLRQQNPI